MAYAEDLKSSGRKRLCGFDSRPGYQNLPIVFSRLTGLLAQCNLDQTTEHDIKDSLKKIIKGQIDPEDGWNIE